MWWGRIWWTHHHFLPLYVDINMQVASIIRPCFDGGSIWRALEKSCTFVSRYFWCTIWRTPLTAFPTTCQKWRRIIISICILFSPASNLTLHWQHCEEDRKTEKELAGGTGFDNEQKFSAYIKQLLCMWAMQRQRVEGLWSVKSCERRNCFYCMIFSVD